MDRITFYVDMYTTLRKPFWLDSEKLDSEITLIQQHIQTPITHNSHSHSHSYSQSQSQSQYHKFDVFHFEFLLTAI